jgi:hypothetical protein|tara:strand:- start:179 stop:340 length:162 start_codon:yes stop_codon:yes gene_type:complete
MKDTDMTSDFIDMMTKRFLNSGGKVRKMKYSKTQEYRVRYYNPPMELRVSSVG